MNLPVHDIQSDNQLNLIQFETGDIVWAANLGHRFWPAIIRHSIDKCIINDSKINVQFLYDNGRTAMINVKHSMLPFDGLDQFLTESKLKLNRDNNRKKLPKNIQRKYRTTACRSWNLAIHEANILKCIDISKRIPIYDSIWLPFVKSTISSIHKRIKNEKISAMDATDSDESIESGYCSESKQLTSRHLLLDVLIEQFDENFKMSNLLESFGKSVPTMESINFADFDDESVTSLNQLANQMRQQTVVENELLKEVCGFFKEMCNIELAPAKRKRTESIASSLEDDKDSVHAVLKTYPETDRLNEPKIKKFKTKIESNEINEERHDEYLACDLNVHDETYLFKNLPTYSVCHYCLEPGDLTVCAGQCGGGYHSNCLQLIPTVKHYKSILMGKSPVYRSPSIDYNGNGNKCARCAPKPSTVCIFCDKDFAESIRICDDDDCLNLFHEKCFELGPQPITQDRQLCPAHICKTCKSQIDVPSIKCLLCSAKYHQLSLCIPAGCLFLSNNQMICVEHCTDAENESNDKRKPLYGDFVWAKLGSFPWWPALVVLPPRIPPKVYRSRKDPHQICVLFFGEHNYGWIWPKNIQLYDGFDTKKCPKFKRADLKAAVAVANEAYEKRMFMNGCSIEKPKHKQPAKQKSTEEDHRKKPKQPLQPKPFKQIPLNLCRTTKLRKQSTELEICQCTEDDPCSCSNRCWNWFSKFECEPDHCPAKGMCQNQNFRNGGQFKTEIKATKGRGFGLFAIDKIPAFEFIIEYVGEIINQNEFDRRFKTIERAETNLYYFMSLDKDVYIDAGECGNDARFINHSCEPNAETEKWMVQGLYRIGIFAKREIMPGEEITFQYSWGGKSTTKCRCGALKCRGHI